MKKTAPPKKVVLSKPLLWGLVGVVATIAITVSLVTYLLWPTDTDRAQSLQQRIFAVEASPPRTERNQLFVELARTIDRMNSNELHAFRQELRDEQEKKVHAAVIDYLLAIDAERTKVLDRELDRFERLQDVFSAVQGGGRGTQRSPSARRSDDHLPEVTAPVIEKTEEQKKQELLQESMFMEAMKKRAKERGLAFHPGRMRI